MGMPLPWRSFLASLASLGFHLSLGFGLMLSSGVVARPAEPPAADIWSGSAVEVDSVGSEQNSGAPSADEAAGSPAPGDEGEPVRETAPASTAAVAATEPPEERPSRVRAAATPNRTKLAEREQVKPEKRVLSPVEAALAAGEATFRGKQGASDDTTAAPSAGPGSFGGEGLPPGVRHLAGAFARALPQAGWRDSTWQDLPLGDAGELVVELSVDEQGKLDDLVYVDPKAAMQQPAPLRRMLERCVMMLRTGTFSIAAKARESGRQRLKIEAKLSQVEADKEKYGWDSPAPGDPGYGEFVLTSGLRMFARISVVR